MIMARKLKVRLRVIVPAVENSISGTSFRPRDIYTSRKGISVEIGNTDAEGRLILADALTLADEDKPALVVDFATLTGAARVALGPDVPAVLHRRRRARRRDRAFRRRPRTIRSGACRCGGLTRRCSIPRWPTLNNVGAGGHGGAITAALFLRSFVDREILAASRHFRLDAGGQARPPGRRRIAVGARALCDALRALFLIHGRARSPHQSVPPRDRGELSQGPGRGRTLRRGHALRDRRADRGLAPRAVARGAARHRGAARRNASPSTRRSRKAGPGASSRPTAMSAGCRPTRLARRARRRRTRSRCRARWRSRDRTSSCRRRRRCRWARGSRSRGRTSASPSPPTAGTCRSRISRRSRRAQADFVAVAEEFLHAPYLWGGKTSLGIDCSGLVQVALQAAGIACPRDSDMQELALGKLSSLAELRRGDLVFWKGHVAIARDGETLLHANAHHMAVAIEPAAEAHRPHQGGGQRSHQREARFNARRAEFPPRGRG